MVDNIRFNFTVNPTDSKQYLLSLAKSLKLTPLNRNGQVKAYQGNLYFKNGVTTVIKGDGSIGRKLPYLRVGVYVYEDHTVKIKIMNSLRKWYSGDRILFEFKDSDFQKCVKKIAKKFAVNEEVLKKAIVTRVEYGSHITLRPEFRCYYACIYSHKYIPTKMIYGNETVKFVGENKDVIFYDKISEDGKKINRYSAKNRKKIMKLALTLRYEISISKVSGEKFAKSHMGTLGDIITNWEQIAESWVKELDNITFVNNMSPKVYQFLEDSQIKEMNDYFIYLGIQSLGIEKMNALLNDRALSLKRSTMAIKYVDIFNRMKALIEEEDFQFLFKQKVLEQAQNLLS
jgi:hypothetical protein